MTSLRLRLPLQNSNRPNRYRQRRMAVPVPRSWFTLRVGGGSAFYVLPEEFRMFNKIISGSLALIALVSTGCATVNKSGFLSGYDRLHQGQYLESYWSDAKLTQQTVSKVFVEAIDTSRITDQPTVTLADASNWLKQATVSSIQAQPRWQAIQEPEQSSSKLFLAITYLTPGSAGGRRFAGELGMGHAIVQVEGKLIDSNSGKEVACFADRRRASGAVGLEDLTGDAGPRLVQRILEKIASDSVKELSASLK